MANVTIVNDNSVQAINTSLFSLQEEIDALQKQLDSAKTKLSNITDTVINDNATTDYTTWSSEKIQEELDEVPYEVIDDSVISNDRTWSSQKINQIGTSVISDTTTATTTTWSSSKINTYLNEKVPTSRTVNGHQLASDITLTASDVGALPDSTVIPTKTSELTNDSGFCEIDDSTTSLTKTWSSDKISTTTSGSGLAIGSILASGTDLSNDGFILCDGRAVSRTDYASLFEKIGTTFGSGDGSTTFNVPNLADKFIEGTGTNALGATGGEATHTLTVDEMPSHTHTFTGTAKNTNTQSANHTHTIPANTYSTGTNGAHTHTYTYKGTAVTGIGSSGNTWKSTSTATTSSAGSHSHSIPSMTTGNNSANHYHSYTPYGTNSNTGGGQAHNNLPPYVCLYYFIKALNVSGTTDSNVINDAVITSSTTWSSEKINQIGTGVIDDSTILTTKTWSSDKINSYREWTSLYYSTTGANSNITLSDSLSNYNEVCIVGYRTTDSVFCKPYILPVTLLQTLSSRFSTYGVMISPWTDSYCYVRYVSGTTLNISSGNGQCKITAVYAR